MNPGLHPDVAWREQEHLSRTTTPLAPQSTCWVGSWHVVEVGSQSEATMVAKEHAVAFPVLVLATVRVDSVAAHACVQSGPPAVVVRVDVAWVEWVVERASRPWV